MDWFKIEKEVWQGCLLSPCLFNLYTEHIIRNARLYELQAGIKTGRRNINNLRHADDTTLSEEFFNLSTDMGKTCRADGKLGRPWESGVREGCPWREQLTVSCYFKVKENMSENMLLDLRLRRALALSREELPWPVLAEIRVKGMGCSVKERIRKGIEVLTLLFPTSGRIWDCP